MTLQELQSFLFKVFQGQIRGHVAELADGRVFYGLLETEERERADGSRFACCRFIGTDGQLIASGSAEREKDAMIQLRFGTCLRSQSCCHC